MMHMQASTAPRPSRAQTEPSAARIVTSERRRVANRGNARASTGLRAAAGKTRVA
jgi:hypothetical protein